MYFNEFRPQKGVTVYISENYKIAVCSVDVVVVVPILSSIVSPQCVCCVKLNLKTKKYVNHFATNKYK